MKPEWRVEGEIIFEQGDRHDLYFLMRACGAEHS